MANSITVQVVWQLWDDALIEEIENYWSAEEMVFSQDASDRARQVVAVARDGEGVIVGLCSVEAAFYEPFKNTFYIYRTSVAKAARGHWISRQLFDSCFSELNSRFEQRPEAPLGVMAMIQNQHLDRSMNQAVRPASQLVFAGYNVLGHQIRVRYFDNALIK